MLGIFISVEPDGARGAAKWCVFQDT
jgi:hypothetical protein